MRIDSSITILPFFHGKSSFAKELRAYCLNNRFDCIAADLPGLFEPFLPEAIEMLPEIGALVARNSTEKLYYLPIDPCDATIEAVRQSFQLHIPFFAIGYPTCEPAKPLPAMPDDYSIAKMGFEPFCALCLQILNSNQPDTIDYLHSRYMAYRLSELKKSYKSILAVVHMRHIPLLCRFLRRSNLGIQFPVPDSYTVILQRINPDHLYFALGELPFITGKYERERYDILTAPFDAVTAIKDLFRETRDSISDTQSGATPLSPVRIQAALTFLRNLTVLSNRLLPSLFDIVEAAKGVGGNSHALQILKNAKYYPWFSLEHTSEMLGIGIDKMRVPEWDITAPAVNTFRDHQLYWRSLSLRPDPSEERKKHYRYKWNPSGMCSHVPEDLAIERFNGKIRTKARKILMEDHAFSEKFSTSIKDGIDIRKTLRHWHTGDIYVKELPPARGKIDTAIIIFDALHDSRYTNCTTWYAEHPDESTLMFYATGLFDNPVGPGITRCQYGGLALIFPPRSVPDIFQLPVTPPPDLCTRLTLGALLYSRENTIAFVAAEKPGARLINLSRHYGKRLVWIPLSSFSHETLIKLRSFHILNGKQVRSWAARFIGD